MSRLVLVHGSVANAEMTWGPALESLRAHFDVVLHTRSGYPPRPPVEHIDFEAQADELAAELRDGDHLAGHSYGGVVSLLAAARTPARLATLTVNEPPAFGLAMIDPVVRAFVTTMTEFVATNPTPRAYLEFFLPIVGSAIALPDPLPPPLEAGARAAMAERLPFEAEIPLDTLALKPFRKFVVSGGHNAAFDAVCDVLERGLSAKRQVLPGAGHSLPRAPGYAEALIAFIDG